MAAVEVLLAQADREKHGIPEPLMFDPSGFNDLPYSVSGGWERELLEVTKQGVTELIAGLDRDLADSKVALVWLACRMADVDVPDFAYFDIAHRRVKIRHVKAKLRRGDVDPPQSGSSEPLSEEAP